MKSDCRLATILARAGIKSDETTGALAAPIHSSTTCQHPEFGKSISFNYARTKNLTHATFEKILATIERANYALATSPGISTIVLAFEIFPVGIKVVAMRNLYGGSFRWFNDKKGGGRFSFEYTNAEVELLAATFDDTNIVYIKTSTNPLVIEFDIGKVANAVHAKGTKLTVDNTFYNPVYQNLIPLGADIVVHSATKYLAEHNDILAGVMTTDGKETYDKLFYNLDTTGPTLSPFDSYMLMRELKTLKFHMEKSTENARDIVAFLERLPAVKEMLYAGKGGVISFRVVDRSKILDIISSLGIIMFAESLGGVESLITYPRTQIHADIPEEVRLFYGLTNNLLCLSIGIGDVEDLIDDLKHVLEA